MARVFARALHLGTIAAFELYYQPHLAPNPRAALPVLQPAYLLDRQPAFLPDIQPPSQLHERVWSVPRPIGSGGLHASSQASGRAGGFRFSVCMLTICAFALFKQARPAARGQRLTARIAALALSARASSNNPSDDENPKPRDEEADEDGVVIP
jgi:hypothetical protein